ncbi:MAG TPA: hypothetical protein VLZ83_04565 [Edaphocola sp.]|nr:hypothetical protein [Edaphocola sp.]
MSLQAYDNIIKKLDTFIRKYYTNQVLRGSIIFLAALLLYIILVTVGEYFFYFSIQIKWTLLILLLGVGGLALIVWVTIPLLKIQKLGKIISHEQAAKIIGDFFPEVEDKLLNFLQLKSQSSSAFESQELLAASIQQKANKLSILPFGNAIDLKQNKKYLPYLAIPFIAALIIFFISPKIFTEGGYRLAQPNVYFVKPAPFQFEILNKNFELIQGQSYTVKAKFKGDKIPPLMQLEINGEILDMQKDEGNSYALTLENIYKDTKFRLKGADYYSEQFSLHVQQRPELKGMIMHLQYPAYTGKKTETLQGLSDVSVPVGTTISWKLKAENTDAVSIHAGNVQQNLKLEKGNFTGAIRFLNSLPYSILLSNNQLKETDSLTYQVQVIEDQFPQVDIQVIKDTTLAQQILITGTAGDDYLISKNQFIYQILSPQQKVIRTGSVALKSGTQVVQFSHYFDIGTLKLTPGQQVNYYVEVWDNDAVHGSKSKRSQIMSWKAPSLNEMDKLMAENAEKMNSSLSTSSAQAEALQEEYKEMQKEMVNSGANNWERSQKLQSMVEKNMDMKQNLENLKKKFEEQMSQAQEKGLSEDLKEKQEALKDQIDNLKDKQLEEQLKKLKELLEKRNQQQNDVNAFKQLEQQNKLFQMDMERLQELMKKLETQIAMENLAKKVDELAKKQEQLMSQTAKKEQSNNDLKKEQQDLKSKLDELMKEDLKEISKKNEEMETPQHLEDIKEQGEEAGEQMENSSQQLDKQNSSESQKSQKQAKNKLQEMSKSLMEMAGGMDMKQIEIDIKATRQLLTNLIRFSFDQEQLINKLKTGGSPNINKYQEIAKEQNRLKTSSELIKDSLFSLSKRIFEIAATINKETTDLDNSIGQAVSALGSRSYGEILTHQQYAMTSSNNLALLLNELLANLMQQQSSGAGSGGGMSGKPKKGSGSASGMMQDIISGQQKMGQGMQKMQGEGQPGGQQPGGQGKGGQSGGQGEGSGSEGSQSGGQGKGEQQAEKIARLAQEQAQLRKQVQELNNLITSQGMGAQVSKEVRAIQAEMDRMETDLVYRKDLQMLMKRNKEILTRMLEAEKAIQEQEEDNKRSAQAGKDMPRPMPSELSNYLKQQQSVLEQYRKGNPILKPFYQKMTEEYLKKVQQP